ncbi:hypothetical protein AVEN_30231-1 [Araneus ventricosus]|uniref:Uncharacterized protein n=1 Tax=Araneus ventricosus TaxID=182803 RepID=A0A4Y2P6E5_ARAVE|nr:hypothetical protein AVEN_30231-1 [Araneus ventricosus]
MPMLHGSHNLNHTQMTRTTPDPATSKVPPHPNGRPILDVSYKRSFTESSLEPAPLQSQVQTATKPQLSSASSLRFCNTCRE